jgi:hypothetical protein
LDYPASPYVKFAERSMAQAQGCAQICEIDHLRACRLMREAQAHGARFAPDDAAATCPPFCI